MDSCWVRSCFCPEDERWNGTQCIAHLDCPCYRTHEHREYAVGSVYTAGCEDW